jgi:hypothetical protein
MKTSPGRRKARTHFEQVPVEIVKKIAARPSKRQKAGSRNVTIEPAWKKTEPYSMQAGSLAPDVTPPSTGWLR